MTTPDEPSSTNNPMVMIDDAFWLAYAQTVVQGTHAQLTRQGERLAVAAGWFWTAYLAFAGWLITEDEPVGRLGAAPVVTLILTYLCATVAQGPGVGTFDPRDPDDIADAIQRSVQTRLTRMRIAYALLGASAILIAAVAWQQ